MGNFKEKNGQTRVGKFLRNAKDLGVKIGPDLLALAGNITGVDALTNLGKAIRKSDDLTPEMKSMALAQLEFDQSEMQEVTKRHAADMVSDSWLSKNVRPMILIFSWLITAVMIFWDSASVSFNVPEFYLNLLVPLLMTVTAFYFGGREWQKHQQIKSVK